MSGFSEMLGAGPYGLYREDVNSNTEEILQKKVTMLCLLVCSEYKHH